MVKKLKLKTLTQVEGLTRKAHMLDQTVHKVANEEKITYNYSILAIFQASKTVWSINRKVILEISPFRKWGTRSITTEATNKKTYHK